MLPVFPNVLSSTQKFQSLRSCIKKCVQKIKYRVTGSRNSNKYKKCEKNKYTIVRD